MTANGGNGGLVRVSSGTISAPVGGQLELFTIPLEVEEMVQTANLHQTKAFGHQWRTAALVYAWTEKGEPGRPRKNASKVMRFSLRAFALLDIRGLGSANTVAKYREAMQRAIDAGLCVEPVPGGTVALPAIDFEEVSPTAANYLSASNEWYTPEKYIDSVRAVLGCIDLDPASCEFANRTVQAAQIFAEADDGLSREWHGRVFLNPPYGTADGDSRAGLFCRKAIAEYEAGRVSEAIILVNSVHSQTWQKPLYAFPVCLVHHRIEFVDAQGHVNPNPTFANVFVYLGKHVRRFAEEFQQHGYCMEPL